MTKRRFAMLVAALVLVGSGVVLFKSGHAAHSLSIPTTTVVVATRDIAPLQTFQAGDLQTRSVSVGALPGAVDTMPYGFAARLPLVAGQVLMPADVGPAIPAGDAVVGVQTTLAQSSGMVRPGQTVQIISVLSASGQNPMSSAVLGTATVLALESSQGTPVVPGAAAPGKTGQTSPDAQVPSEATLLVPQALAPKVAAADAASKIYLAVIP